MGVIETVPSVVFKTRVRDESVPGPNPYRWQYLTTEEIFKGKKVFLKDLGSNGGNDRDFNLIGGKSF